MAFEIGQRIVCVGDTNRPGKRWYPGGAPKLGAIYTVRAIGLRTMDGSPAIRLVEIQHDVPQWGTDMAYREARFEALPRKTTSIEIFRKMLLPSRQRETV